MLALVAFFLAPTFSLRFSTTGHCHCRFFDAVAAGCVPVIINDAWIVAVAPFASRVNYNAFTITVPETVWAGDSAAAAHLIYNRPLGERRRMFESLIRAQRELLWRHENSNVATNALLAARDCLA
jgi:hypothetical protein